MSSEVFGVAYAALTALPFAMQLALAAGAPLGRFTVGGRFPGRLPAAWRLLALVQAALLAGMALVVLDRAGVIRSGLPAVLIWPTLALTLATLAANAASRSKPERLLWTPVTVLMALACLGVLLT